MNPANLRWWHFVGQGFAYLCFMVFIGYLSDSPVWTTVSENKSTVKLSVNHAGQLKSACRRRSEEELARLAPNMRTPTECPRERSPIHLELSLDDKMIYSETLQPGGIGGDREVSAYKRFTVDSGEHFVQVRMKDAMTLQEYNYRLEKVIHLEPEKVLVIRFDKLKKGFVLD